jgi:hypothetical protein
MGMVEIRNQSVVGSRWEKKLTFVLRNNSTFKIVKMHFELNNLNDEMEKPIYVHDICCIMHDVDEYKKKNHVCLLHPMNLLWRL